MRESIGLVLLAILLKSIYKYTPKLTPTILQVSLFIYTGMHNTYNWCSCAIIYSFLFVAIISTKKEEGTILLLHHQIT